MIASTGSRDERDTDDRVVVLPFELDGTRYCVHAARVRGVFGVDTTTLDRDGDSDPWFAGEIGPDDARIRLVDLGRIFLPTRSSITGEGQVLVFDETDGSGARYGWLVADADVTTAVGLDGLDRPRSPGRFVHGYVDHETGELIWLDDRAINQ